MLFFNRRNKGSNFCIISKLQYFTRHNIIYVNHKETWPQIRPLWHSTRTGSQSDVALLTMCIVTSLHASFHVNKLRTQYLKNISGINMPITHSIDNINRVAKCFTNPYSTCKYEQNTILLYIKIMRHLKKVAYQVIYNARTWYNFTSIILFMYNLISFVY